MESKERPWGVAVIAVLQLVSGVFAIFDGISFTDLGRSATALGASDGSLLLAVGIAGLVIGGLSIILSIGLWFLLKWSWGGTVLVRILDIVLGITGIFVGATNLLSIMLSGVIVYYLLQRETRAAFGLGRGG